MRNTLWFVIFMLVVIGVLFSLSSKKYPPLPRDKVHAAITDTTVCFECHGPGKNYPQKPSHPPKFECMKCHK
jgi:hypothetical protein